MPTTATMEMPMIDNANSADNAINANNVSALHGLKGFGFRVPGSATKAIELARLLRNSEPET
jgi:hypothetical protein